MAVESVICGGCYLVDKTKIISHWPVEETVALIEEESLQGGGPGMNMAVNLKRLGLMAEVKAVGALGDDEYGRYVRNICEKYGIDQTGLRLAPGLNTSYTDCLTSRKTGKRTFFHYQGANAHLSPNHFDFSNCRGGLCHLGAPGIHDALDGPWGGAENGWAEVLRKAQGAGLKTNMEFISLPAEDLARLGRPCLPLLNYIIINDFEAGALAGLEAVPGGETHIDEVKKAVLRLLELGVRELAAVHFPGGCVVGRPGEKLFSAPSLCLPQEALVCSVGAGDAFASGLMYGLLENWPLDESLALAHAASAVNLQSMSTNECLLPAKTCLEQVARWGWRPMF